MQFVHPIHKVFLQEKGIAKIITLGCPYSRKQQLQSLFGYYHAVTKPKHK